MPETLDPTTIVSASRQRKTLEISDEFIASVGKRLINPITLRKGDDGPTLVAGGRRLEGLKRFGLTELVENIHFRFIENLSPDEAEEVELEENVQREDLPWREHVEAFGRLYNLKRAKGKTRKEICTELNIDEIWAWKINIVFRNLDNPALATTPSGIDHAYSILQTIAERKTVQIVGDISKAGTQIFGQTQQFGQGIPDPILDPQPRKDEEEEEKVPTPAPEPIPEPSPFVLCANFLDWITTYSGPKFTLIHCDFPYDVKYDSYAKSTTSTSEDYDFTGYWNLLDGFLDNLDRIASYSCHIMFWFSMRTYQETKNKLEAAGLQLDYIPLVWMKSDNSGIIPGGGTPIYPRRIYETAFLCNRGKRPLVRPLANAYAAPLPTNSIHSSQKSEPMLRHFFSMFVDETTDMFDPTCGSGAALRAADALGARSVLGLELNPDYAKAAETATQRAITLRKATQK